MNTPKNNFPFYNHVPRPLGILILLFMFIPPTFSGGAYLSNITEMNSELGVWVEDIQLASFFTNIGMCLFPPFMLRFLQNRRVKQTYLYCFSMLIILNIICATTESLPILLFTCLIIGFVRVMVILNYTFTIAPYLTGMDTLSMFTMPTMPAPDVQYVLERKRTFLMPVLYFYILIIAQLSNIVTAWFAYNYHWQNAYYFVVALLLIACLLTITTMPSETKKGKWSPEKHFIPEMSLVAIALYCMTYVLVYGKNLDWFYNMSIRIHCAIFCLAGGLFILLSLNKHKSHYLPFSVLRYRNVVIAIFLFIIAMIFNSASSFVSSFAKIATPINNYQSATLSVWGIVGIVCGLIISIILIMLRVRFRSIFATALLFMAAANIYMYCQFQSISTFNLMILPTILNYTGLLMLYSLVAAFGMKSLPPRYLVTFVFLMILSRNAIAPVIGSSLYSNWLYERQQHYITRLVETSTTSSASIVASKMNLTKQATLLAMKDITGKTIWMILATGLIVMILPYHKGETT